ncbi:hypothetical protein ANN_00270 [Periplaneta americana]|uniref:Uncharacterized protein n=1 Tax=Periplaneta americana TaxID=6978 RepID=A0ABQ8TTI8_PERAM|nr:hypothetical protein ANN_00270 [Periplaneta americana]
MDSKVASRLGAVVASRLGPVVAAVMVFVHTERAALHAGSKEFEVLQTLWLDPSLEVGDAGAVYSEDLNGGIGRGRILQYDDGRCNISNFFTNRGFKVLDVMKDTTVDLTLKIPPQKEVWCSEIRRNRGPPNVT